MAHVGEEFALVLIGALELGGLLGEHGLSAAQLVAPALQHLRLLLELRVGLLQLGLLRLQPLLGIAQCAGLHFQLLVADAQLLLLGLQLFGLPLGFGEQFFEARPVFRGAHGDAHRLGHTVQ